MVAAVVQRVPVDPDPVPRADLIPRLLSIAKTVRQLMGIKLAGCGVMVGQDQFLLRLHGSEGRSLTELAEALCVRASTASKMATIMTRKGWVRREGDDADCRRVLIHLTSEGRLVREKVRAALDGLDAELMAFLDDDGQKLAVLANVEAVLSARLRRLR